MSHSLYAIAQHEPGSALSAKRTPISNSDAIHRWWVGQLPTAQVPEVLTKLSKIREDGVWIACDCTAAAENPPLFTVAYRENNGKSGTIYMRRLVGRGEHAQSCDFRFDMKEPEPDDIPRPDAPGQNPQPTTPPAFLDDEHPTALGDPLGKKRQGPERRKEGQRQDPLGRQLFWLLNKSNMQRWPLVGTSPVAMLLKTAEDMPLKNGLSLANILFCKSEAWERGWMEDAFAACERAKLPAQAILICPVVSASKSEGWVKFSEYGDKVQVSGQIRASDEQSAARYPMLMYARIVRPSGDTPRIARAYLHPISSLRHWMAIDSGYERTALGVIQDACLRLRSEHISCTIEKPVYDWGETGARPDFVIHGADAGKSHTIVVETMGFSDPEYVSRKQATIAKLDGYVVFKDQRHLQDSTIDGKLLRFIMGNMKGTLRPS